MRHFSRRAFLRFALAAFLCLAVRAASADDVLELVSGAKVTGKILERTAQSVKMEARIGARTVTSTYPVARIKAIVTNGQRQDLAAASSAAGDPPPSKPPATRPAPGATARPPAASSGPLPSGVPSRTRAEVEAMVVAAGHTPPDWFDSTPLAYPQTLDLSFPQPPPGGWSNQTNVGQYVWDIVNPNPGRWKEGVRLMHHLLVVNQKNAGTVRRVMGTLGTMYQNLHEDHARAAFWWEQAAARSGLNSREGVMLAECYWKLGNRDMAIEMLNRTPSTFQSIKLWADLGETQKALAIADSAIRSNQQLEQAYLYAGDACRIAGDEARALAYYEQGAAVQPASQNPNQDKRSIDRCRASAEAIKLFQLADANRVPDGQYQSSSLGYEAPITVEVTVRNKKIESVRVAQHREKQFYSSISDTPRKIVEKQGVRGVDATSGATITSEAIINATAKALAGGAK
ncbi:MAG: FMN-binding protein [Planctomycetales bacterium]